MLKPQKKKPKVQVYQKRKIKWIGKRTDIPPEGAVKEGNSYYIYR